MSQAGGGWASTDYVNRAMRIAYRAMSAALIERMQREWGTRWLDELNQRVSDTNKRLGGRPGFRKLQTFSADGKGINWDFGKLMRALEHGVIALKELDAIMERVQSYAREARDNRNEVAHASADLDPNDVKRDHRYIDTLTRLTDLVAGRDAGNAVDEVLQEMLPDVRAKAASLQESGAHPDVVARYREVIIELEQEAATVSRADAEPNSPSAAQSEDAQTGKRAPRRSSRIMLGAIVAMGAGIIAIAQFADQSHDTPQTPRQIAPEIASAPPGAAAEAIVVDPRVTPTPTPPPVRTEPSIDTGFADRLRLVRERATSLDAARERGRGVADAQDALIEAADDLRPEDIARGELQDRLALAAADRAREERQAGQQRIAFLMQLAEDVLLAGEPVSLRTARELGEAYRKLSLADRERMSEAERAQIDRACRMEAVQDPLVITPANRCVPGPD